MVAMKFTAPFVSNFLFSNQAPNKESVKDPKTPAKTSTIAKTIGFGEYGVFENI